VTLLLAGELHSTEVSAERSVFIAFQVSVYLMETAILFAISTCKNNGRCRIMLAPPAFAEYHLDDRGAILHPRFRLRFQAIFVFYLRAYLKHEILGVCSSRYRLFRDE
jgi:hypothetical protein